MTDSTPAKRRSGKEGPIHWFHLERTASPVRPVFINFAVTDVRRKFVLPAHRHDTYEIIYVERGDYRARVNGALLSLSADDVLVLKPGDSHEDSFRPGLRTIGFMFTFLKESAAMGTPLDIFIPGIRPCDQHFRAKRDIFMPVMETLKRETASDDPIAPYLADHSGYVFFWLVMRHFPRRYIAEHVFSAVNDQGMLSRITSLFERHRGERLSIAAMADECGMSGSYFAHSAARVLGMPPMRAFMLYKMERARRMLETGSSVTEVSGALGFKSPVHFSRLFKKAYGRPPLAFRKGQSRDV